MDDVAGHERAGEDGLHRSVAHYLGCESELPAQRRQCDTRAVFLHEPEQGAANHDRKDDRSFDPVMENQWDCAADYEDQDERDFELSQ